MLTMSFAAALLSVACVSPSGAYRELRSDRHAPTASDLEGTWRVTPASAADAARRVCRSAMFELGLSRFAAMGHARLICSTIRAG